MAMATTVEVVFGSIAFAVFCAMAVFPTVPFLPIGRIAGSLLGGWLMVIFRVITLDQACDAIDLSFLAVLISTQVISVSLEQADMFKYLGKMLSYKSRGGKDLLCRICLISAISSSLFTNDTTCVILTEFVLKVARQNNLPPEPFLLALASSANIGSSATPIGNPQNLIIAIQSGISFGKFAAGIVPAMLLGIVVNMVIILCMYWRLLSPVKDEELAVPLLGESRNNEPFRSPSNLLQNNSERVYNARIDSDRSSVVSKENDGLPHTKEDTGSKRSLGMDSLNRATENGGSLKFVDEKEERWKRSLWKTCVYLVTLGMLIALLMGLKTSWTTITTAIVLVVIDFKDAHRCLDKVSYSLLIFFCGMFISVDGFNKTGIPSAFWDLMEPHAQIDSATGIIVLAAVILVLSNVASNVPTVLLLGARVAASAAAISATQQTKAWLILAWVSTVAGNFTLLGSAGNLIVCKEARRAISGYTLSFWHHLRFGIPSTLIVIAIGLPLIRG
ncbi:silicon efflux transporter LSI2-like [Aristolochia californica]|uniref:silicon efflux transporter LSI2-like n=1 Tax=Aristolochia californica TaxID=171875 RepID=UPI0035DB770C